MVEFISYDGEWPCLCSGTLVIKVNKKLYELQSPLSSTGSCGFIGDYEDSFVTKGPWEIYANTLPKELESYHDEIEKVVNENVPWGCCGGCL